MYDVERPFHRLVHHFIARIFHGAGDGDDLQFSIPALLGLLSIPSAFGSIQLLSKYSTLTLFLMGLPQFDVYRASLPDEYFFIVYSMVVTGAIVIMKWDRLFPDRQDYDNLAALPISAWQSFMASLIALLFLTSLFAVVINGAACIIFPFVVTNIYNSFAVTGEFLIAHGAAVLLASFFTCFGLLLIMVTTMLLTPRRYLAAVSLTVRIACALGLIAMFGSVLTVPRFLLSATPPVYTAYIPAVWFLDLHQTLLHRGTPRTGTGILSVELTAVTFVLAMVLYALSYYRHFMRIPERDGMIQGRGRDTHSLTRQALDWITVRTPFQRGTYHFAMKTLLRSERHCLLFCTAASIGMFFSAQTIVNVLADPVRRVLDPRLLSVSLTVAYFIVVSLRALFDLPSDRNASWIFRSMIDIRRHESRAVALKVMVSAVVPLLFLVGLPLHVTLWGWVPALLHTGYVLMCSIALAELLLLRFRKIPFTCSHIASKDRVLVMIILFLMGWNLFGPANARFERGLLLHPAGFLLVVPCFAGLLWGIRSFQRNLPLQDRVLLFEDRPAPMVELLNLSKP